MRRQVFIRGVVMDFRPLCFAVSFLSGGGDVSLSDLPKEDVRRGCGRFVYLINHEFGTGIHVALRGCRAGETEKRRIDLIFLKSIAVHENKAVVREYRIVPVNDVFAEDEVQERVCETEFSDVDVDFDALRALSERLEGRSCPSGLRRIVSVGEHPEYAAKAVGFFQKNWGRPSTLKMYEDCIMHAMDVENPFPRWYLAFDGENIAGGAGLILNDFISRADLYPWLCALFVEKEYRGRGYAFALIDRAKKDAKAAGMRFLYLCTGLCGFYEKAGFEYIADGWHPDGAQSRIYRTAL